MEVFFSGLVFLLGWGYLRLFILRLDKTIMAVAAFPVGMALWVMGTAGIFLVHIPFSPWLVAILTFLPLMLINIRFGEAISRRELKAVVPWSLAFLVVDALAIYLDLTVITTDSMFIRVLGYHLVSQGGFFGEARALLASFSSFLGLIEASAGRLGIELIRGWLPLNMLSVLLLLIFGGRRVLLTYSQLSSINVWGLPLLGALAVVSAFPFFWGGFYFKTTQIQSFMMLSACMGAFFAASEKEPAWLSLTLVGLLATIPTRLEAGITALPTLVTIMALRDIPLRSRILIIGPVGVAFGAWYALIIISSFAHGLFGVYELFAIGVLPGLFGLAAFSLFLPIAKPYWAALDRLLAILPLIMLGTLIIFILGYATIDPKTALRSVKAFWCFLENPTNGATAFWAVMAIISLLFATIRVAVKNTSVFAVSMIGYILVIFAIAVQLSWKHCGTHDSTNRILAVVMPMAVFTVLLQYAGRPRNLRPFNPSNRSKIQLFIFKK